MTNRAVLYGRETRLYRRDLPSNSEIRRCKFVPHIAVFYNPAGNQPWGTDSFQHGDVVLHATGFTHDRGVNSRHREGKCGMRPWARPCWFGRASFSRPPLPYQDLILHS